MYDVTFDLYGTGIGCIKHLVQFLLHYMNYPKVFYAKCVVNTNTTNNASIN